MREIAAMLPKTLKVLDKLLSGTESKHLHALDCACEEALIKAWARVHGTGHKSKAA